MERCSNLCRVSEGKSLRTICADPDMPDMGVVFHWVADHPEFAKIYRLARTMHADAAHEDLIVLEDRVAAGEIEPHAASVIIRSKQWRMERACPKKYTVAHNISLSGQDGGPIKTEQRHQPNPFGDTLESVKEILAEAEEEKNNNLQ
jgi:hypothetical protein